VNLNFVGLATLRELQRELSFFKTRVDQHEDKLDQTTARVDYLEESVADDRAKTILLLSDHCERLDHHSNMARPAFTGKLERNFILLKDKPGEEAPMDVEPRNQ
jgi:hypothetical protein